MSKNQQKVKRDQDQIWISKEQKYKGIMAQVATFDSDQTRVILVAHFPSTIRYLESLLQSASFAYEVYPTPLDARRLATVTEYESPFKVMLVMASTLPTEVSEKNATITGNAIEINFVIAEHHPLLAQDDIVINFAKKLPYNCKLTFHGALDGALMKFFNVDKVQQWMSSLKIPENQSISNSSVDKIIRKAQKKLTKRVTHNLSADSAEEWFQQNIVEKK